MCVGDTIGSAVETTWRALRDKEKSKYYATDVPRAT